MYLIFFIDIRFEGNKENCKFNIVTKVTFFSTECPKNPIRILLKTYVLMGRFLQMEPSTLKIMGICNILIFILFIILFILC